MISAVVACSEGMPIRESARKYNVPASTLFRRVRGIVEMGCKPGPNPVLSTPVEDKLSNYLVEMADMGFGFSRQEVMRLAFQIADKSGIKHPFKNGAAGHKWFAAFQSRHPNLTLRKPESLSYVRAKAVNPVTIQDFFAKLGALYARLNLLSKPMQVYNVDESGLNITQHKGKVVADIKRRGVHRVVASEKGRNHTIVACGSASGYILPPMIIFPRVRVSEALKVSAPPGSMIAAQKKGWITAELYLKWFKFFLEHIPPARPVLLIQDGCSSHISIELIELAKENDVHLLCLPSHTAHVLQPLDVGVFSSFKHHIGLTLNMLLRSSEGRVPTSEDIPAILSEAWPKSMTPVNLMSGFRKSGIHPLNPSYIHDRVFAPSIATCPSEQSESPVPSLTEGSATMTEDSAEDNPAESIDSLETHAVSSKSSTSSLSSAMESLCLKPKLTRKTKRKVQPSYNSVAVCITEDDFVTEYKHNKGQKKKEKEKKQPNGGRKKQTSTRPTKSTSAVTASTRTKSTSDLVSVRTSTRAKSTSVRASTRAKPTRSKSTREQSPTSTTTQLTSAIRVSTRSQSRSIATSTSSKTKTQSVASARTQSPDSLNSQSDCECAICGEHYGDRSATWIQCNICDDWFDLECAGVSDEHLQEEYFCDLCAPC